MRKFCSINNVRSLRELIRKQKKQILLADKEAVKDIKNKRLGSYFHSDDPTRIARGVFYSHVGLARQALEEEFGSVYQEYKKNKRETKPK